MEVGGCFADGLHSLNLDGANLSGANLAGTTLRIASLKGTDLKGADLSGATLTMVYNADGSDFRGANLSGAQLTKIISAVGINFDAADLSGAGLSEISNADGIRLGGATLNSATFSRIAGASGPVKPGSLPPGWSFVYQSPLWIASRGGTGQLFGGVLVGPGSRVDADLSGTDLSGLNLAGANFSGSNLFQADFRLANLSGARFERATLESTNFGSANVEGATFAGASISNPVGTGIVGTPTDLPWPWKIEAGRFSSGRYVVLPPDHSLANLDLRGKEIVWGGPGDRWLRDLTNVNLDGQDLAGVGITGVMRNVSLNGANLEGTSFRLAEFDGVRGCGITGTPAALPSMMPGIGRPDSFGAYAAKVVNGCLVGAGVDMSGLDLAGFDLTGVSLFGSRLEGAKLAGSTGVPTTTVLGGFPLVARGRPATIPESWALLPVTGWSGDPPGSDYLIVTDASTLNLDGMTGAFVSTLPNLRIDRSQVLRNANLSGRRLVGSSLTGVNMEGSDLSGSDLSNSTLVSVDGGGTAVPSSGAVPAGATRPTYGVKLFRSRLTGVNLNGAKLRFAGLDGVRSGGLKGAPASLPSGWKLTSGYLVGPKADLTKANLFGAALSGIKLATATLTGASTCGVASKPSSLPTGWVAAGSCLIGPGANLASANLAKLDFGKAKLQGTDLTGANIQGAKLAKATLSGVVGSGLVGTPASLPKGWKLTGGRLVQG